MKDCKAQEVKAIDAARVCKRGNLSPSVLTESELKRSLKLVLLRGYFSSEKYPLYVDQLLLEVALQSKVSSG